jgi:hypothetical protein
MDDGICRDLLTVIGVCSIVVYVSFNYVCLEVLMSVRVQVILKEDEAARFKSQAIKESKSLSAWLRDAGNKMLDLEHQQQSLIHPNTLKKFFQACNKREKGVEPDWEDHKRLIVEGFQSGNKP